MAQWPAALPQRPLLEGARFEPGANVIRTDFEAGVAKTRRRSTAVADEVTLAVLMTRDQLDIFRAFFRDTIAGTGAFDWVDWRASGEPVAVYRFRASPAVQPLGGLWWRVTLPLEILPA